MDADDETYAWPPGRADKDGGGRWLAPALSTLVTLPVAFVAYLLGAVHAMGCDACDGTAEAAFDRHLGHAMDVMLAVLGLALAMLAAAWMLPAGARHRGTRLVLSALAPVTALLGYVAFGAVFGGPPDG